MPYGVRIEGLREAQKLLGTNIQPALKAATKAIAVELQGKIAPYPPATEANSPSNPLGRWYERGYGPKRQRKDGTVTGRQTSQLLNRRWAIRVAGGIGHSLGNAATYAKFVHGANDQARFHGRRGWVTDRAAIEKLIASGVVRRIVRQAITGAFRKYGR